MRSTKRSDEEGAFGHGSVREQAVVLVARGDQSDAERIEWAKQINPPAVWKRFEAEMQAIAAAWEERRRQGLGLL